nr:retrotransposon protein, putative, Ty1-copia subclass [Tanacetum cinerariifolium]
MPTNDESFDQCVSCLTSKLTRKPFPHRTKRATDLLGLILIDVCGPLRHVSRQGASYFITFTDDYSCYGYVYLLKHKHEVFETFKVFKNEVENQLEKTIKALRSDRGESVARILNEIPTKKVDKTPYEFGSVRTHRDPKRLCLNVEVEEHSLKDLNEPIDYKAAMLYLKYDKWLNVMNAEMQSIKDNQVWRFVDLPPMARMVDYEETFSLVADIRAIRILIAIAAFYDFEIWKMNVKTAFLNGFLDEDIYMVQPEGFVHPKHLKKSSRKPAFVCIDVDTSRETRVRRKDTIGLYLTRRSLEVLRKFHLTTLEGQFNQLSHVSSLLLSKPGKY